MGERKCRNGVGRWFRRGGVRRMCGRDRGLRGWTGRRRSGALRREGLSRVSRQSRRRKTENRRDSIGSIGRIALLRKCGSGMILLNTGRTAPRVTGTGDPGGGF